MSVQPPGPMFSAPKKKSVLPWVLAGAGVIVLAVMLFAAVLVAGLFGAGSKVNTAESPTLAASFQYPQGWVRTGENVTVIKEDGSKPAERFNAINRHKDATALLVYEAGAKPRQVLTQRQIHDAIDTGIQKQVDATQEDLVYFRSTSGFGCVADFNYTHKPTLVERDGMYGYSYG
ncbi:hypothetical protein [Arthrobacter antibioticus]|uniref:hypothetical protein n=1 Tax=Arthrobacter sp. H35-MC1 TaxID=3046203 RepID=UPI0024B92B99|nr:hypothetical protein [Arthrobacter sp. H35-MC1]MDJ0316801.1 hypothetical protein [Arthrobacter sp. H35-MC1]